MVLMEYREMIKYIIKKKGENSSVGFFVYGFVENSDNRCCNCGCGWVDGGRDKR